MATQKIIMIPEGDDNYGTELYPKTTASQVVEETNKKFMTDAERTKLTGIATNATDDTSLNEHLAESATQEALGHIIVGEGINIDSEGKISTSPWLKIEEITLEEDTPQIDINVPEGYNEFRITGKVRTPVNSAILQMRLNTHSSGYHYRLLTNTAITNLINTSHIQITSATARFGSTTPSIFDIVIKDFAGNYSYIEVFSTRTSNIQFQDSCNIWGIWANNSKIQSIRLLVDANQFGIGSTFNVWGRKI